MKCSRSLQKPKEGEELESALKELEEHFGEYLPEYSDLEDLPAYDIDIVAEKINSMVARDSIDVHEINALFAWASFPGLKGAHIDVSLLVFSTTMLWTNSLNYNYPEIYFSKMWSKGNLE